MTQEEVMSTVGDFVNSVYIIGLHELFEKYPDKIDLTDDEGMLWRVAIARKSIELVDYLLDFYEETKLSGNPEDMEYKLAYLKLKNMLDDAVEAHDPIPGIYERIAPYLTKEGDDDSEQDLSGFAEEGAMANAPHYPLRKWHSESDLVLMSPEMHRIWHSSSESELSSWGSLESHLHRVHPLGEDSFVHHVDSE